MQVIFLIRQDDRKSLRMKSTAKQENKFNFKRNIYIPKMCVDPCPVGSTTSASWLKLKSSHFLKCCKQNLSVTVCVKFVPRLN